MYTLGISAFYHNSSCCLFRDGVLVSALQEERVTRKKGDGSFPVNSIRKILLAENITIRDIGLICYYENPLKKLERQLSMNLTPEEVEKAQKKFLAVKLNLSHYLGYMGEVHYANHHLSHVANAIYQSTWEAGDFLSVDGVGELETITWGHFDQSGIFKKGNVEYPHSLGLLYSSVTAFLGFSVNDEEFKVMGLAAHGKNLFVDAMKKELILSSGCELKLKTECLSPEKLSHLFGVPPRTPGGPIFESHRNIAASLQMLLEEELHSLVRQAFPAGSKRLVFSGGVAHNSLANQKLSSLPEIGELFIPAAPNDSGSAIGACVLGLREKKEIIPALSSRTVPYWGPALSKDNLGDLEKYFIPEDQTQIARELTDGKIVAVCRGRMEFGDRALGNRSLLAHPGFPGIKDLLNLKIKKREDYRPFAPIVPREFAHEYFEMKEENLLMSKTYPVRETKRSLLRGVENVDGTARVQVLVKEQNQWLNELLLKFGSLSGVPVLINTSFNMNGEPIVMTEEEAVDVFLRTEIDWLILEGRMLRKESIPQRFLEAYRLNVKAPVLSIFKSSYEFV